MIFPSVGPRIEWLVAKIHSWIYNCACYKYITIKVRKKWAINLLDDIIGIAVMIVSYLIVILINIFTVGAVIAAVVFITKVLTHEYD